ncbi:MAG: ABC transporter permease [Woeseiaceae bacterium]|jgi:sodium transport system permease protein|nr:ABC transporter permease [Woeseiaceae bacterium]
MSTFLAVFRKEVIDYARDRRTLLTSLLIGPLFGPILFGFVINLSIERSLKGATETTEVAVVGAEFAPNLVRYLASQRIEAVDGPADLDAAKAAVETGTHDVVLIIPKGFGERLGAGEPARVELVSDLANSAGEREARRLRQVLERYNAELAGIRLVARGVSPLVMRPVSVDEVDVSTPSGRSALLLGMLSYFFVFSLLIGGMNLAIDSTAGERERGSLEPLVSLPVRRETIMLGKIAATCIYMLIALTLSLSAFVVALGFLPLQSLGMTPNFGPGTVLFAVILFLPFSLLGAAMMTLVASFTKSYKEAQSWVSMLLFAPTVPILIVSILTLRPRLEFMFIPSLSQHLLLVDRIKNEPLDPLYFLISFVSTLILGILMTAVAARLYRREGLLG